MRITIIGNSVGLRVRPNVNSNCCNYGCLLDRKKLASGKGEICVDNISLGASTIEDIVGNIDCYIRKYPDLYVINIGVVDASTRDISRWFSRLVNSKKKGNIELMAKYIYSIFFKPIRPVWVKVRGKQGWVSKRKFESYFEFFIQTLIRETRARIIVVPINIANDRIERELPGSRDRHNSFNGIMKRITKKYNQIWIDNLELNSEIHYPDGVHFSSEGHQLLAHKLSNIINSLVD